MPQQDIAEKHFTEHNDIFADLFNMAFHNGRPVILPEHLTPRPTRELITESEKFGELERDVSKVWKKMNVNLAILGLENQSQPDKYMPIRAYCYNAATYHEQLEQIKKGTIKNLLPVITLVVHFGTEPWDKNLSLREIMNIPEEYKNYVNDHKINLLQLSYLSEEQISRFQTPDLRAVADYLRQKRLDPDNYVPSKEALKHYYDVARVMAALTGDKGFVLHYNERVRAANESEVSMCEMIDKIKDTARAEGMQKGMQKGMQQGIQQGRDEGKIETARNAIKMGLSTEQIMQLTQLPLETIQSLHN